METQEGAKNVGTKKAVLKQIVVLMPTYKIMCGEYAERNKEHQGAAKYQS
jgi:hypothetical protein